MLSIHMYKIYMYLSNLGKLEKHHDKSLRVLKHGTASGGATYTSTL